MSKFSRLIDWKLAEIERKQRKKSYIVPIIFIIGILLAFFVLRNNKGITGMGGADLLEEKCVVPYEDMIIMNDTIFCLGTYYLNDSDMDGVLIINTDFVTINCNNAIFEGNKTTNSAGLKISNHNNVTIHNCTFLNYYQAIYANNAHNNSIYYNSIQNSSKNGIVLFYVNNNYIYHNYINDSNNNYALSPSGIKVYYGNSNIIFNNTMGNMYRSISIEGGTNNLIENNNCFNSNHTSIQIYYANYSTIINNNIYYSGHNGIDIDSFFNNVSNNYIFDFHHNGIDLYESESTEWGAYNNVFSNIITKPDAIGDLNSAGIYISSSRYNSFYNNIIYNNTYGDSPSGILIDGDVLYSNGNIVYNNTISNTSYCLWTQSYNTTMYRNIMTGCSVYDIRLSSYVNNQQTLVNLWNNTFSDNVANYIIWRNSTINTTISENASQINITNYYSNGYSYSYLIRNSSKGNIIIFKVNNTDESIFLITNLVSPYNDIYNQTSNSVLASNVNSYSLTLAPGQTIIIGNYTPEEPNNSIFSCTLPNKTWNQSDILPNIYNLSACFTDPLNQSMNFSVTGNNSINVSINNGLVSLYAPSWNGTEYITFWAFGTDNRNASTTISLTFLPPCSNFVCDSYENCSSCAADCGSCLYCGDSVCNNGETCSTCSADCGSCPVLAPSSGGSSGGSGGGSAPKPAPLVVDNEPISFEASQSQKVSFTSKGKQHSLQVESINETAAHILVQSTPIRDIINVGETKRYILDETFVAITLLSIHQLKAQFQITEMVNSISSPEEKKVIAEQPTIIEQVTLPDNQQPLNINQTSKDTVFFSSTDPKNIVYYSIFATSMIIVFLMYLYMVKRINTL